MALILSGRFSTTSATSPSMVSSTGRSTSDSGIRGALPGGEDLQLARADGDPVLVDDVPPVRDQPRLRILVRLLDDLDVEVDRVVDPRRRGVAEAVTAVVREDRRRVTRHSQAGAHREHHDPRGDPLPEHRPLGGYLVDVRIEPV